MNRRYADGPLTGGAVDSRHYLAAETPEETPARLDAFLRARRQ